MWDIQVFVNEGGRCPVLEFFMSLTPFDRVKAFKQLKKVLDDHVIRDGPRAPDGIVHRVAGLDQITFGNFRILCYQPDGEGQTMVMLHASRKSSQKTKKSDITAAERRRQLDIEIVQANNKKPVTQQAHRKSVQSLMEGT